MQYWTMYHSEVNNVFCATFQIIVFAILHQAMQSVGTSSTVPWVSDNINIPLKLASLPMIKFGTPKKTMCHVHRISNHTAVHDQ